MRLFGSFKVTDRIRIGGSTGGGRKRKSSSKGNAGCGLIILVLLLVLVPISLIKSCIGGDEAETTTETTTIVSSIGVEELSFAFDEYELDVGDDRTTWVKVSGTEDFTVDDFVFVSDDESIATIEFKEISLDSYIDVTLKGVSPGTTTIYVKTADDAVSTEKITVTVLEAETSTEAETTEKETDAPAAVPNTPETTKSITTEKKSVEYVLNTNTKKIHKSSCSSVEDIKPENRSSTNDFNEAIDQGYEPCKRCNPSGN